MVVAAERRPSRFTRRALLLALPPLPVLLVKVRPSRRVEELILASGVHGLGGRGPTRSWPMCGSDDQPTMLRLEFNLVRQLRLFEQSLGHADTARIADADNAGLGNHVTTL